MIRRQVLKRERPTDFRLGDYVPANHLLRSIDRFLSDHPLCKKRAEKARVRPATEVDHVVPLS